MNPPDALPPLPELQAGLSRWDRILLAMLVVLITLVGIEHQWLLLMAAAVMLMTWTVGVRGGQESYRAGWMRGRGQMAIDLYAAQQAEGLLSCDDTAELIVGWIADDRRRMAERMFGMYRT